MYHLMSGKSTQKVTILSIELDLHLELGLGLEGLLYLDQFVLVCSGAVKKLAGASLLHDVGPDKIVARSEFIENTNISL